MNYTVTCYMQARQTITFAISGTSLNDVSTRLDQSIQSTRVITLQDGVTIDTRQMLAYDITPAHLLKQA